MLLYWLALLFPTLIVLGYWGSLFRRVASRLGLERAGRGYTGVIDGIRISLGRVNNSTDSPFEIAASAPEVLTALSLERRVMTVPRPGDRVSTGDVDFDAGMNLTSEPTSALALLDHDTRQLLLAGRKRGHVRVTNGTVHIRPAGLVTERKVQALVRDAIALAKSLSLPKEEIPARLALVACADHNVLVRRRALAALVLSLPDDPQTGKTCEALQNDPDPGVKLIANLARQTAGSLEAALASGDEQIRELAVTLIWSRGDQTSTEALTKALNPIPAEHIVIYILQTLENSGTAAALAPIARLAKSLTPLLREAAERALDKIRERSHLAENTGALSLAAGEGGELSVAEDPRGAIWPAD